MAWLAAKVYLKIGPWLAEALSVPESLSSLYYMYHHYFSTSPMQMSNTLISHHGHGNARTSNILQLHFSFLKTCLLVCVKARLTALSATSPRVTKGGEKEWGYMYRVIRYLTCISNKLNCPFLFPTLLLIWVNPKSGFYTLTRYSSVAKAHM